MTSKGLTLLAAVMALVIVPAWALAASARTGDATGPAEPGNSGAGSQPGLAAACAGGVESDFNGDGVADIAIADPDATVNGQPGAGRVHVVYGGSQASQTISQANSYVQGGPEAGDRFGFALASYDANGDGCGDLAVSSPYEALATATEAGNLQVLLGSPTGFGPNGVIYYSQNQSDMPGGGEAGDRLGYSLAAGSTAAGGAFLVIGVPGEDLDNSAGVSQVDTGAFMYVRGTTKLMVHQDHPGVAGANEAGDRFGYQVAATSRHVAVGGLGEAIGEDAFSGTVVLFTHDVAAGSIGAFDQDLPGQSGESEPDDQLGQSLSMVDYIPPGGSATDARSLLAVGSPGEKMSNNTVPWAGRVVIVEVSDQTVEQLDLSQGSVDVADDLENSDYFGWSVRLVNRTPGQAATWQNLLLAVGVPGEDATGPVNQGGVQAFSMVGPPGDHDAWAHPLMAGAGWRAQEDGGLGQYVGTSATHLYIADPFGATPAVYAIPWQNLTDGSADPVVVYAPGRGGLLTGGVGTFGAAIA